MRGKIGVLGSLLGKALGRAAGGVAAVARLVARAAVAGGQLAVMFAALGVGNLLDWLKVEQDALPIPPAPVRAAELPPTADGEVREAAGEPELEQQGEPEEPEAPWDEAIDEEPEQDIEKLAPTPGMEAHAGESAPNGGAEVHIVSSDGAAQAPEAEEVPGEAEQAESAVGAPAVLPRDEQPAADVAGGTPLDEQAVAAASVEQELPGAGPGVPDIEFEDEPAPTAKQPKRVNVPMVAAAARRISYSAPEILESEQQAAARAAAEAVPARDAVVLPDYLGAASRVYNKRLLRVRPLRLFLFPAVFSLLLLCVVYLFAGLFPLGGKTLMWGDLSAQSIPFMAQFRDVVTGGNTVFFSMANASGADFWGVVLFYLASPFTFLGLLVPKAALGGFADILVMLKVALAACTATGYFRYHHTFFRRGEKQAAVLGVMYAFGGYTMLYYQNLVWLDELVYFPLLMAAFSLLVRERRFGPYALVLALMLVCQFQIGYTVILSVLIFGGLYVILYAKRRDKGAIAIKLAQGTVLALLASAVVWLPGILQYFHAVRPAPLFESLLAGGENMAGLAAALPVLLCTPAILAAVVFLLVRRAFFRPRVVYVFTCFLLLAVPLFVRPVSMMWHGGSFGAVPVRYGFVPLLFGLVLVAAALEKLDGVRDMPASTGKGYVLLGGGLLLFALAAVFVLAAFKAEAVGGSLKWAVLVAVCGVVAFGCALAARGLRLVSRQVFVLGLCAALALGGLYQSAVYIGAAAQPAQQYRAMADLAGQLGADAGRVRQSGNFGASNMVGALGYDSISHDSDLLRAEYFAAMTKLGYSGYQTDLTGAGGTLMADDLLGVGAVLAKADETDTAYRVWDADAGPLYENGLYALMPAGGEPAYARVAARTVDEIAAVPDGDRIHAQEWLYYLLYGAPGQLLERYAPAADGVAVSYDSTQGVYSVACGAAGGTLLYTIELDGPATLYFDAARTVAAGQPHGEYGNFDVRVDGALLEAGYPSAENNGILCLGRFAGGRVLVQVDVRESCTLESFGVFGIADAAARVAARTGTKVPLEVDGQDLRASLTANGGELLVVAVPYDEGFRATVNGADAKIHKVLDCFMAVELAAGANIVEFSFRTPGFLAGAILSAVGAVCILLVLLAQGRRPVPLEVRETGGEKNARSLIVIAFLIEIIVLYILPFLVMALGRAMDVQNFLKIF